VLAKPFLIFVKSSPLKLKPVFLLSISLCIVFNSFAQADNEIQVYASPTVTEKKTIAELHNNYTFNGPKDLADPKSARWINHTLEITHGLAKNFEIGFYTFVALSPDGKY